MQQKRKGHNKVPECPIYFNSNTYKQHVAVKVHDLQKTKNQGATIYRKKEKLKYKSSTHLSHYN